MLRSLSLKNFKSWREMHMRFAPVTGIFGTNSSGKSSILQALLLLKQTAQSNDRRQLLRIGGEGCIVDFGSFRDIVHGRGDATLEIGLEWGEAAYRVELDAPDSLVSLARLHFSTTGRIFPSEYFDLIRGPEGLTLKTAEGESPCDEAFGGIFARPLYPELSNRLYLALERLVVDVVYGTFYVGPLRSRPSRLQQWSSAPPSHVGYAGEDAFAALLVPAASGVSDAMLLGLGDEASSPSGAQLQESVASWLQRLRLLHSFRVHEIARDSGIFEIRVKLTADSTEVLLTDVGVGVAQLFPVLVQCLYAPRGSTIILEQPELHLHPSAQSELADFFIEVAHDRDLTLIIESHSEHLLRRLQRRIAEEKASTEEVALYFVTHDGKESQLHDLELDEFGNIRNWPKDFFGDRFGEVAAISEAQDKRRLGA